MAVTLPEIKDLERLESKVDTLNSQMNLLLGLIVVQQRDASVVGGVSETTLRDKFRREEVDLLGIDGSKFNYMKLSTVPGLRKRSPRSR